MVSTSGSQLLPHEAVRGLIEHLMPLATVLTPNLPEAMLILSEAGCPVGDPKNVDDLVSIAWAVQGLGPKYVLVKGGHSPFKSNGDVAETDEEREVMVDVLVGQGVMTKIETSYQRSKNTHGTGCSLACECSRMMFEYWKLILAAAIASNLANGLAVLQAVKKACRYVEAGIRTATDIGHGNGPINHFHSTFTLPFAP